MSAEPPATGCAPPPAAAARLARGDRVLIVTVIGLLAALLAVPHVGVVGTSDFDQIWYGARALLHGASPYGAVGPGRAFPWPFPLFYPLPAVLAAVLFVALALAFTRARWHRVLAPLSFSFCYGAAISQWTPILVAAPAVRG